MSVKVEPQEQSTQVSMTMGPKKGGVLTAGIEFNGKGLRLVVNGVNQGIGVDLDGEELTALIDALLDLSDKAGIPYIAYGRVPRR